MDLQAISEVPGAPKYQTLKNRSSSRNWTDQRKTYKYLTSTHAALSPTVMDVAEAARKTVSDVTARMDRLIDQAEMITRHVGIARKMLSQSAEGLDAIDTSSLKPTEIVQLIKESTNLERLCLGLETQRTATSVDFKDLSDEELEAIARGESEA